MMRPSWFAIALLTVIFSGCAKHSVAAPNDLALPSGEHVTISSAHGDTFTNVNGVKRSVFYVSYETRHDIDDTQSLRDEALRVWAAYRPHIAGADYDACLVTPMKRTAGGSEAGHPFYFTRQTDGTWVLVGDQ